MVKKRMTKSDEVLSTRCPSCSGRLRSNRKLRLGDIIICPDCEESLEVVKLAPFKLAWSLLGDDTEWADLENDANYKNSYDSYDNQDWR